MRIMRLGPLFIVGLFFSVTSIQAQQPPTVATPARDPQALAVLQASVKAMGGGAPLDFTATGSVTATVGSESQEGTVQILTRGTGESLEAMSLPDLSQTTIYSYWMAGRTTGSAAQQQLSGELGMTSQTALYPLPLLAGALSNPDMSLEYVGQETVDGATTQHIRLWNTFASKPRLQMLAPFSVRDVWINGSSLLPVRISFTRQAAGGRAFKTLVELDFANYQQNGGFAYPSQISESLNGTPWLTIAIESVSFNTGLQDSQFQLTCNNQGD